MHPAISVWAISVMPNGDIVSGSSDGIVRVFSEAEERWADVEELKVSTPPVLTIHIADVWDRMRL